MELNRKHTVPTLAVERTCQNATATVDGIKLKLSVYPEGNAKETKGALRILLLI